MLCHDGFQCILKLLVESRHIEGRLILFQFLYRLNLDGLLCSLLSCRLFLGFLSCHLFLCFSFYLFPCFCCHLLFMGRFLLLHV